MKMYRMTSWWKCLLLLISPLLMTSLTTVEAGSTPTTSNVTTPSPVTHSTVVRSYGWVIALIVLASIGILVVIAIEIGILIRIFITRDCGSAWLGQLLVFAAFCSYLTMYAFLPFPCFTTCGIIRFCVGVCYAMLFSVAFVKLVAILCHDRHTGLLVVLFFFVWGVQVVIDIQWLIRDISVVDRINNSDGLICNPGYTQHVQSLVYNMFLIAACLVLSLVAQCRTESMKDRIVSLLIGCGFLLTIAVWIVWILLGFLINNTEFHDPCVAFGLLITTSIMLLFLVPPKFHGITKRRQSTINRSNGRGGAQARNAGYIPEFTTEFPNSSYSRQGEDQITVEFQHPALDGEEGERTLERQEAQRVQAVGDERTLERQEARRVQAVGDERTLESQEARRVQAVRDERALEGQEARIMQAVRNDKTFDRHDGRTVEAVVDDRIIYSSVPGQPIPQQQQQQSEYMNTAQMRRADPGEGQKVKAVVDDRIIYETGPVQARPQQSTEYMNTAEMRRADHVTRPTLTKVVHHGSVSSYNDKRATHSGRVTPVSTSSRPGTNVNQGSLVYVVS